MGPEVKFPPDYHMTLQTWHSSKAKEHDTVGLSQLPMAGNAKPLDLSAL